MKITKSDSHWVGKRSKVLNGAGTYNWCTDDDLEHWETKAPSGSSGSNEGSTHGSLNKGKEIVREQYRGSTVRHEGDGADSGSPTPFLLGHPHPQQQQQTGLAETHNRSSTPLRGHPWSQQRQAGEGAISSF